MDRSADALIGRVLDGRYLVGPKIARGGMATVYEATDLRLDRTVAVKVMHAGLADDEEFVARFQREARSAARLAHHNVVAVFDTGDDHGTLFLVMEYVPGLTLRDLIRKEAPLSPAKALAMIEPVLSALAAAHDAGILHRDVKPENVLLADDGRVKVADFGLARAINSETQHTATGGVLIGTVSYLSPELVVNGKADARADVYAAGVLIYEMLTGHKPHQADSPIQVAYKHVHEDIPAPSASTRGIPPYVDALVARATARDTALRPADARVLLHQVRRVRNALDHGVVDDPDLLADLTPTTPIGGGRTPTGELPAHIIEPQELAELADWDDQVYDQERDGHIVPPPTEPRPPAPGATAASATELAPGQGDADHRPAARAARGAGRLVLRRRPLHLDPERAQPQRGSRPREARPRGPGPEGRGPRLLRDGPEGPRPLHRPQPRRPRAQGRHRRRDDLAGSRAAQGPRRAQPDAGRRAAGARRVQAGLRRGDRRFDEKIAKGRVITTDPAPGTTLRRNSAVDVVVSKGPKPIKIPDFTGKPAAPAEKALTQRGFKVDATQVNDDTVPKGRVISQSPNTGTGQRGDVISLVVSKGPVMVEVPDVVRMGLADAEDRLTAAGFKIEVRHSSVYIGVQYVVSTDPGGGSMAPKGSTVIVTIV